MISKDKNKVWKLKRIISLLILTILLLFYWVRVNYIDMDFKNSELESMNYEIYEKDSIIKILETRIDSVFKTKTEKTNIEIKINKKKENKTKKDTTETVQKKDTVVPEMKSDTISLKN